MRGELLKKERKGRGEGGRREKPRRLFVAPMGSAMIEKAIPSSKNI